MSRRTTVTGLALVAALALGASACSSSGSGSSGASGSAGGGSAKALVVESNPVPSFTNDFNPFDSKSSGYEQNITGLVFEPLMQFNTLNSAQPPIPWLATKWAWSNGNKTLTLTLRSGVKWSDGKPLTADDVKFSFELLAKNPAGNQWGVPTATSITASGNTVVLNYAASESASLANIGELPIVPQHIWSSIANPATAVIDNTKAIGTGPYTVDKFTSQNITFKANPAYWGGAPAVKAVSVPAYANNDAATLALSQGEIDLAGNNINNVQSTFVAKNPSTNHLFQSSAPYFPATNTVTLLLNNKSTNAPALADKAVRQAISAGIDRQSLATQCETNYETPATSSGGLTLPPDQGLLDSKVANDLSKTSDTSKVSSILTADGYTKSGGKWTKGGKPIKFTIIDPNSYGDYWCGAQAIAKQLTAEGMEVTANGAFTPDTWGTNVNNGTYDASIHWGQGGTGFQRLQFLADSTLSAPVGKPAGNDLERYQSAAADSAIKAYENATSASAQQAALNQLQETISSDVPSVPILYGAGWYEYTDANFTGWPTQSNPYVNPGPNNEAYEYLILHLKPKG